MRLLVQSTGRERLAVLRPRNGILVLHTLRWPEEIRDPGDLSSPAPTTNRELALAELLMDEMAGVDIAGLHDDYTQALNSLVDTLAATARQHRPRAAATGGSDGGAGEIRARCPARPK